MVQVGVALPILLLVHLRHDRHSIPRPDGRITPGVAQVGYQLRVLRAHRVGVGMGC